MGNRENIFKEGKKKYRKYRYCIFSTSTLSLIFQPKISSYLFIHWQIKKPHLSILINKSPLRGIRDLVFLLKQWQCDLESGKLLVSPLLWSNHTLVTMKLSGVVPCHREAAGPIRQAAPSNWSWWVPEEATDYSWWSAVESDQSLGYCWKWEGGSPLMRLCPCNLSPLMDPITFCDLCGFHEGDEMEEEIYCWRTRRYERDPGVDSKIFF